MFQTDENVLETIKDDNWKMYQTNGLYKIRNVEKREIEKYKIFYGVGECI